MIVELQWIDEDGGYYYVALPLGTLYERPVPFMQCSHGWHQADLHTCTPLLLQHPLQHARLLDHFHAAACPP
jgi:hypothetical protein